MIKLIPHIFSFSGTIAVGFQWLSRLQQAHAQLQKANEDLISP